jgi:parvulin-like peptidyl-prolyl isomerase
VKGFDHRQGKRAWTGVHKINLTPLSLEERVDLAVSASRRATGIFCHYGPELISHVSPETREDGEVLDHFLELARFGLLRPYLRQQLISEAVSGENLDDESRQQALNWFAQEHDLRSGEDFEAFRREQLLTPQALNEQIERPMRLALHCERHFGAKAEARFLDRKTQLDRVVYSLLRLRDPGLARELYLRIDEGEANFADLAASYAEGPEKATRGIVGPVPLTQAHPVLADRLRTATPGDLLEPFQIESWWLVVRLESLTPAIFDEETARQMSQELFQQWLVEQEQRRLEQLANRLSAANAHSAVEAAIPTL